MIEKKERRQRQTDRSRRRRRCRAERRNYTHHCGGSSHARTEVGWMFNG